MKKTRTRTRYNLKSAKYQAAMIDMLSTFIAGVMVKQFARMVDKPKRKINAKGKRKSKAD